VIATTVPVAPVIRASNVKKRGGQTGAKKVERPQSFWHGLCSTYDESAPTLHRFFPTIASAAVATGNIDTSSNMEEDASE
jgi:hypothetical protein